MRPYFSLLSFDYFLQLCTKCIHILVRFLYTNLYVYPSWRSLLITNIRTFKSPLRIYFSSPKSIFHDENIPHFVAFSTLANLFLTVFVLIIIVFQLGISHYQSHEKNHSLSQSLPPFQPGRLTALRGHIGSRPAADNLALTVSTFY